MRLRQRGAEVKGSRRRRKRIKVERVGKKDIVEKRCGNEERLRLGQRARQRGSRVKIEMIAKRLS